MHREDLARSARELAPVSRRAAEAFGARSRSLADAVTAAMLARQDLDELIGHGNREIMQDNHWNFSRFMESMCYGFDSELLVDTVAWALSTYLARGFRLGYWRVVLPEWREAGFKELGEDFEEIGTMYFWIETHLDDFVKLYEIQATMGLQST